MKLKLHICLLLLLSIFTLSSSIAFGEDLERFHYTEDVEIYNNQDDFIMLEISPEVYASMSPGFKDLRLYLQEQELDYLVFPKENQQSKDVYRALDILNKGTVGITYSFEFMPPQDMHVGDIRYSIRLNGTQYLIRADIYGSNDRKEWKHLKTQTIYGIDGEFNKFSLENIQYDRIKIEYELLDNGDSLEVNSVVYTQTEAIINRGVLQDTDYTRLENSKEKATAIMIDQQYNHYPTNQVIIESKEKYFYRQVTLSGSNDNESWNDISRTFIFRDAVGEKLDIDYGPREYRYLKMLITNEDNQPLEISKIQTEVLPLYILVNVANKLSDFTIKAYWGDPTLSGPKYDISNLNITLDPQLYKRFEILSYGKNEVFMGEEKQLPFSERFPWLMPVSLSLLAVGVLLFLYKTVKQVG